MSQNKLNYDDSPEVAPETLPQVYHPPPQEQTTWEQPRAEPSSPYTYGTNSIAYLSEKRGRGTLCGCSILVFALSAIIAILAAAVIGLAAGTGVSTSKYNDAISRLNSLNSSCSALQGTGSGTTTATSSSARPTSTSTVSDITNGCSDTQDVTSGTEYKSQFFGNATYNATYTMYCGRNAPNPPLFSLFTADFNGCMEACTFWNNYNITKGGCKAVSFIPPWTSIAIAASIKAPGDCYLKPGPQTKTSLEISSTKDGSHAAILNS